MISGFELVGVLLPPLMRIAGDIVSRSTQKELIKQQQQLQMVLSEKQQQAQVELAEKQQEAQLKLEYLRISSQAELEKEKQAFQEKLAKLNHKQAKELQEFVQSVNWAINQENINFQRWHLEQEKAWQKQLATYNRETQLLMATYQRETALQLPEVQKLFENWPLRILPSQILNSHHGDNIIPLRIIIAPPEVDFERFGDTEQGFPKIGKHLAEGLRQFLSKNYPLNSQTRPTEFLDGAWDSKRFHGGSSIKALFEMLKSEPVLILETEVEGDYLNFRVAYWGLGQTLYSYESVISKLPYREICYESAKARARNWQDTRDKLLALGKSLEEVNRLGGDNAINLTILEEAEELKSSGIDISNLAFHYKVGQKDFEALCQFLIVCHCLISGWFADAHHLIYHDASPLLPQLLPDLIKDVHDPQVLRAIVLGYREIYQSIETEQPTWIPEIALQLADSLKHLVDKSWAREQVNYAVQSWLKLRGLLQPDGFESALGTMESALTIEDREYVEKLNECLTAVGEKKCINLMAAYYNRGIRLYQQGEDQSALLDFEQAIQLNPNYAEAYYERGLVYYQQKDYQRAISDFNLAIQANPDWAEAYNKRGLAYAKQEQYQKAIENYTQVIKINPNWAETYYNRGNSYYKLENYKNALADYNQALSINPTLAVAAKNLAIVQGVLKELNRKQEEERKRRLENFSVAYTLNLPTSAENDSIYSIAISPDGQTLVSGSNSEILLWQLSTGQRVYAIQGNYWTSIYSLIISPDGRNLVSSCGSEIILWQLSTGQKILTLRGHSGKVDSLAISPDGQYIVSGSTDKTIKIWQLSTGKELATLKGHSGAVYSVAISPDGQTLVSASYDKTIKIWQLSTGQELRTLSGHGWSVCSLAISPDGQSLVSAGVDQTIKIWQLSTGQELRTLMGHSSYVYSVAISPDGQYIVSGSADKTIKIWQLSTGKEFATLKGHSGAVCSVAISPDGQTLVSASYDKTAQIWRVPLEVAEKNGGMETIHHNREDDLQGKVGQTTSNTQEVSGNWLDANPF
jgi:tetratricopeptide (TPR) repeat protein